MSVEWRSAVCFFTSISNGRLQRLYNRSWWRLTRATLASSRGQRKTSRRWWFWWVLHATDALYYRPQQRPSPLSIFTSNLSGNIYRKIWCSKQIIMTRLSIHVERLSAFCLFPGAFPKSIAMDLFPDINTQLTFLMDFCFLPVILEKSACPIHRGAISLPLLSTGIFLEKRKEGVALWKGPMLTPLLGCPFPGGPVINSVFGRRCRKTASRGREDTRVWYRETMFSQMVS